MTKEVKFVVNPLINWFKKQKANWKLYKPNFGIAATGWDIEAQRKNQDLLIEAKYIDGPFLSSLNGLVTAPLVNRPQHLLKKKYRSWSYRICWAIGASYKSRNIYQLLFDYFSRNLIFWRHYEKDLRVKYIFFVNEGKVAKIKFSKFLNMAKAYKTRGINLEQRRKTAELLLRKIIKFT